MPQNRPVQGYDVSVSVMGPNGPELVGEWQECDINITNETEEYHETNSRSPILLDGDIKFDGKLKRGYLNTNIVATTLGTNTIQPGVAIPATPRFTISCYINAPDKGLVGRYRLTGVKFEKLSIAIKAGKAVVDNDLSFKAEGIIED
jgi:hypothetical protein